MIKMSGADAQQLFLLPHIRCRAPKLRARTHMLRRARGAHAANTALGKIRFHEKQADHPEHHAGQDNALEPELLPQAENHDQRQQHQRRGNPRAARHAHCHASEQHQRRIAEHNAHRLADASGQYRGQTQRQQHTEKAGKMIWINERAGAAPRILRRPGEMPHALRAGDYLYQPVDGDPGSAQNHHVEYQLSAVRLV